MSLIGIETSPDLMMTLVIVMVILFVLIRFFFERLIARINGSVFQQRASVQMFARAVILTVFSLIILELFGLLKGELFSLHNPQTGLIITAVGLGVGILVALMSSLAIRKGYGAGYDRLVEDAKPDKGLMLATLLFLAGPSEDIFFIGFGQNLLRFMGWGAIIAYAVIFVAYHYANVVSKVETNQEFMGALPVRVVIAILLGLSFYLTGTLVWGMIVHNLVDTLSYTALLVASREQVPSG